MDYNTQVDPESAQIVLERANPVLVTLSVTLKSALQSSSLPALRRAGPLGQLLARQAEAFAIEDGMDNHALGCTCDGLPHDIINFLHDPLACAIALGWSDGVVIR